MTYFNVEMLQNNGVGKHFNLIWLIRDNLIQFNYIHMQT